MQPTVQWQGDNVQEIEQLLRHHLARADKEGDKLLVRGLGLKLQLELGDSLILDGNRLGIRRAETAEPLKATYATWKGDNVSEIARFMTDYKVEFMVSGERLHVLAGKNSVVLKRGDRLIHRDGQVIVSVAGKQHRYG